jgi:DNA-binding PadR family transcriptional regulator
MAMICEARVRKQEGAAMPELPELNPVIHGKLRLALLSLLTGVEEAEFTWLRAKTGSTDGNLGAQLLKLEEAGYVSVEKKFVQRKPQTLYRMTEAGREALTEYVQALKQLLGGAMEQGLEKGTRKLFALPHGSCDAP